MANNTVSLMVYLQHALPAIPTNPPPHPGRNTTNTADEADDISGIAVWHGFNLQTIIHRYGNILGQTHLPPDPMPTSPPRAITAGNALRSKIYEYVFPRVRRGLRAAFNTLTATNQMNGLTSVSIDVGEAAKIIENYKPDTAYFALALPAGTSWNRAPGDIKPSWKWSTALANHPMDTYRTEFRQALSQVNWYMKQHNSRYGFILTNQELVVIRRLDNHGNLELAPPIPFTAGGTVAQPRMTVLLALWYLGMLAAQDQGVDRWDM
ncbi:hypothetical protein DTO207G8_984 [Paecilomyces variotii]|nr:hypothetical protein DTO207G8_984 [Paecilomyces variotii]KAJ9286845.1 hypothetical protein DTO021C3_5577 [Paecilomyces variotii]